MKRLINSVSQWAEKYNGSRKAIFIQFILRQCYRAGRLARKILSIITRKKNVNQDFMPPVMRSEDMCKINDAFKILFCGDLILLEDQVKRAWNGKEYIFDDMFEYTRKYISDSDLSIGVLEGPLAGVEAGYSTSNYGDGKKLVLNFPDSFAESIKRAGFSLVTTANNHLLDKGIKGAFRTLDILDKIKLSHTGSYRSPEEKSKNCIKLIEKDGLKFAVLSYTYGSNNYSEKDLLHDKNLNFVTSILVPPSSKNFKSVKDSIKKDFERAKEMNPDFIIVLPHMGSQFLKKPDYYQAAWVKIFKEFGADIILSDHTHSVQPAEITNENGKNIFTAYCPGNYANVYREFNGDASILVEVYIDKAEKKIISGGIVPMWTASYMNGNYRPIPLNDIANDLELNGKFTTYDFSRAVEINDVITDTIFGRQINFDMVRERYYFNEDGFIREISKPLKDVNTSCKFLSKVNSYSSVCFIGDSVTQGSKNGGVPWYEPLLEYIRPKIYNCSYGGAVVNSLIEHAGEISGHKSGLYVIAIGTNDVRYCNKEICAMTPEEYISRLNYFEELITKNDPDADFIYIAPWYSIDGDPFCPLSYEEKTAKNNLFSDSLERHCKNKNFMYINANPFIHDSVMHKYSGYYLIDHIHPNTSRGVYLYSEAVISQ